MAEDPKAIAVWEEETYQSDEYLSTPYLESAY